jgi:hypothetical protein
VTSYSYGTQLHENPSTGLQAHGQDGAVLCFSSPSLSHFTTDRQSVGRSVSQSARLGVEPLLGLMTRC